MKDFVNGLSSCNEALNLEPEHTKALFESLIILIYFIRYRRSKCRTLNINSG